MRLSHANKAKLRPISSHEADCEATIDLRYVYAIESRYWGPDPVVACVDETVGQWISLLPVVAGVAPWWEISR